MSLQPGSVLLISVALCCASTAGCGRAGRTPHQQGIPTEGGTGGDESDPPLASEAGMPGDGGTSSGGQGADGGNAAKGLCPAAGLAADRPLLGWSDGAALNLLFSAGEVRKIAPIPTESPAPTTGISVLRLEAGRGGWSIATLRAAVATDETSQVAILRPDGSTTWQGLIENPYPTVFAGPHGSVINYSGKLLVIDEGGTALEHEEQDFYIRALGAVGAAGEVPVSWEERSDDGSLMDHLYFIQPATARTELPVVERSRWVLVGDAFHYVEAINGDLVWRREGVTAKETVIQVPSTTDGQLAHYGAWVVLSVGAVPVALAREDGSDARLVPTQVTSPPAFNVSANRDWLVGSTELGFPVWRLNMETGTVDDLNDTSFGMRRLFDASFCTPPPATDAQGHLLLGLRDDSVGGLFREVPGQAGAWEALGQPVRGVIYVAPSAWGDTVVASAETGENTFCPDMFGEWPDEPASDDVLEGASVQLLHPSAEPRVLSTELVMHPSGSCAVLWTPDANAELLDVPTGTTHSMPPSPLRPVWLQ